MMAVIKRRKSDKTKYEDSIKKIQYDFEIPALVSFPRSGSHYLMILMELYFDQSNMNVSFFDKEEAKFCHTHDTLLNTRKKEAIYLYRKDVCSVMFSHFYLQDIDAGKNPEIFEDKVLLYGAHLDKWLFNEKFTEKKAIVCYEELFNNPKTEFSKICKFFGKRIASKKFQDCVEQVKDKGYVKSLITYDKTIMKSVNDPDYENKREIFRTTYKDKIYEMLSNYKYYDVLKIINS